MQQCQGVEPQTQYTDACSSVRVWNPKHSTLIHAAVSGCAISKHSTLIHAAVSGCAISKHSTLIHAAVPGCVVSRHSTRIHASVSGCINLKTVLMEQNTTIHTDSYTSGSRGGPGPSPYPPKFVAPDIQIKWL